MKDFDSRIHEVRVESWERALVLAESLRTWVFRGQASADWKLETSFERKAKQYKLMPDTWAEAETEILREFSRQAHLHMTSLPEKQRQLELLSLVQHHGGPTRLLDFTSSFYIASFFALESAKDEGVVCQP